MSTEHGSCTWLFPDDDIPPPGDRDPNDAQAEVVITVYFDVDER